MSNSINTNIAAYYAQGNIDTASRAAALNVARLSSGNAIIQASDNVAALAVGTSLATQVSTLQTAQTNASAANSLLQVADGAVAQIQSILQTMESVANQAQSGSLTDTNRGFLDQEFQALTSEINSLAKGTQFNGVNLIDGSIATGGSNNPLRTASIATVTANAALTVTGFTATTNVGQFKSFVLDVASGATQNDTAFQGDLSKGIFLSTGTTDNTQHAYTVSLALNGSVWNGTLAVDATTLALDNGTSTITFSVNALAAGVTATQFGTQLTTSLASAKGFAIHTVATTLATDSAGNNIAGSAITASSTAGTLLDSFSGSNVTIQSQLFTTGTAQKLPSISDWSATGIGSGVVFSVVVNGTTYSTAGAVAGTDTTVKTATFNGGAAGLLQLYAQGNTSSNEVLQVALGAISTSARIDTASNVTNLVNALNTAFGSGGNQGGLTFQLGSTSDANVTVNIANTQSSALFNGATLDVKTAGTAATSATAVSTAINTATATRSGIGALESQVGFAISALQNSVQNQDAARSQLLDVNIATESAAFATNQVKLQAGISVLAQANTQVQALLKLIA